MAEVVAALGVLASVAQLADFGFRLSVKLLTFSNAVASADTSIKDISNDVSLTSTVLKELYRILQEDEPHVVSDNAIEATSQTVKECLSIFEQLSDALDKSFANLGMLENKGKTKRAKVALERLKWPFKQNKMEFLRSNLDRLRSSLTLMLQVLSYARDISNRKAADSSFAYQKHLIESLARSEQEAKNRCLALQNAIDGKKSEPVFNPFINTSVHIAETRDLGTMPQSIESEPPATPVVHPQTIVGELHLCFQLLNDVLIYHSAISNFSKLSSMGYDQLRVTLEKIHVKELNQLKEEFSDAPTHIKAEAAQNLETRLKELARVGYLKERKRAPLEPVSTADDEQDMKELRQKYEEEIKRMQNDMQKAIAKKDEETTEEIKKIRAQPEQGISQRNEIDEKLTRQRREHAELKFEFVAQKIKMEQEVLRKESRQAFENERRAAALQAEIDSTTSVMRENINKVSQRGERLDSLQDKTDNLSVAVQGFRRGANRVRGYRSLWETAYRGVTQGAEIIGGVGIKGYKAVKLATGAVYDAAAGLLEDEQVPPGQAPDTDQIESESKQQLSQSGDSELPVGSDVSEDDLEAAEGLEAMRIAEEHDKMIMNAANRIGLTDNLPVPHDVGMGYDSVTGRMIGDEKKQGVDCKIVSGDHQASPACGDDEENEESEDEYIVEELLAKWTNLPGV